MKTYLSAVMPALQSPPSLARYPQPTPLKSEKTNEMCLSPRSLAGNSCSSRLIMCISKVNHVRVQGGELSWTCVSVCLLVLQH